MSTVQQNAHAAQTANAMMNHMLRMQLYVITTVAKAPREQIEAMLPEHLAHQIALEKEGVLRPKQLSLLNLKTQGAC